MSTTSRRGTAPRLSRQKIEQILVQNGHFIDAIEDRQKKGNVIEADVLLRLLHRNLVFLAFHADTEQNSNVFLPMIQRLNGFPRPGQPRAPPHHSAQNQQHMNNHNNLQQPPGPPQPVRLALHPRPVAHSDWPQVQYPPPNPPLYLPNTQGNFAQPPPAHHINYQPSYGTPSNVQRTYSVLPQPQPLRAQPGPQWPSLQRAPPPPYPGQPPYKISGRGAGTSHRYLPYGSPSGATYPPQYLYGQQPELYQLPPLGPPTEHSQPGQGPPGPPEMGGNGNTCTGLESTTILEQCIDQSSIHFFQPEFPFRVEF